MAYFMAYEAGLFEHEPYKHAVISLAVKKMSHGWKEAFLRGVGCNWLVCLAVWLSMAANDVVGKGKTRLNQNLLS